MLCRNCCKEVDIDAPVCINCGFEPLAASNYCQECGASSKLNQKLCIECGFELLNFNINTAEYAGFFRRLGAFLIDTAVLIAIIFPIVMILMIIEELVILTGTYEYEIFEIMMDALVYIFVTIIFWLYYALMEASSKQGTLGKMALGIIVVDADGKRISFARASGKHFGRYISGSILLIGYAMAIFTKRNQALHDIMAETYVIRKKKKTYSPYY